MKGRNIEEIIKNHQEYPTIFCWNELELKYLNSIYNHYSAV